MKAEDIRRLSRELPTFLERFKPHLGRPEVQRAVEVYLRGLFSDTHKKNAEAMALELDTIGVRALQRLLTSAKWNEDGAIDELQRAVAESLGNKEGLLVIDDTGFAKKGKYSCGVGRQYTGTLGKEDNCQVGVFLTYRTETAHTFLNRRLDLQESWFQPQARDLRDAARIPQEAVFRTKPELALEMILQARALKVPHRWVIMDSGYGDNPALLDTLEEEDFTYVADVSCSTHVWTQLPKTYVPRGSGKGRKPKRRQLRPGQPPSQRVDQIAAALPREAFHRSTLREGEKGPIRLEAAALRVWDRRDKLPGREQWLLISRDLSQKPQTKYRLSNASAGIARKKLLQVGGHRWSEEQCFEQGKDDLGLDEYQTRSWPGWHRHVALVMLAHYFLVHALASGGKRQRTRHSPSTASSSRARPGRKSKAV